jgi:hypothetical protein
MTGRGGARAPLPAVHRSIVSSETDARTRRSPGERMRSDDDVIIARAMIKAYAGGAFAAASQRVADHARAGESDGADFWRNVAEIIRELDET